MLTTDLANLILLDQQVLKLLVVLLDLEYLEVIEAQ
jgi:hypothetical protein